MLFQAFAINCLLFLYDSQTSRFAIIRLTNDIQLLMCCFICCQMMERPKLNLDPSILWQPSLAFQLVEMRGLEPLTSSLQRRRSPD